VCEIGLKHAQPGRGAEKRGPGPKQGPCQPGIGAGDPWPMLQRTMARARATPGDRPAWSLQRIIHQVARATARGQLRLVTGQLRLVNLGEPPASWPRSPDSCAWATYTRPFRLVDRPRATARFTGQLRQLARANGARRKKTGQGPVE